MKITIYLLGTALILLSTSCLTRRTVTKNGSVVESKYMFKRPLKEAFKNSQ